MKLVFSFCLLISISHAQIRGNLDFSVFDWNDGSSLIKLSQSDLEQYQKDVYDELNIGLPTRVLKYRDYKSSEFKTHFTNAFMNLSETSFPFVMVLNAFDVKEANIQDSHLQYYYNILRFSKNTHGVIFLVSDRSNNKDNSLNYAVAQKLDPGKHVFHLSIGQRVSELPALLIKIIENQADYPEKFDLNKDKMLSFHELMNGISLALKTEFADRFTVYTVSKRDDDSMTVVIE